MGVIVVEELVIIIGIGQFKRHSLEEHVNLINCQNTVIQFSRRYHLIPHQ